MKYCVFVKKSIHSSEILENNSRLQKSTISRWYSELIVLRSILQIPEDKLNEIGCKTKVRVYERKLLESFEKATILV